MPELFDLQWTVAGRDVVINQREWIVFARIKGIGVEVKIVWVTKSEVTARLMIGACDSLVMVDDRAGEEPGFRGRHDAVAVGGRVDK